ncbi:Uncharacterised protein [uncultured Clostridium sp.]|nr:Uncharacterised protein [uncultured Clostridium sp.]
MEIKRKPVVPRRQRKNREEERKSEAGGAWGAKGSLWCPAVKEKAGKKRGNPRRAGHGRRKRAVVPRRQRKSREEERKSEPGGAWRAKRSLWCPAAKEKTGKKRENPRRAGHGIRKRAVVPRRQRKNREEERKSEAGGAWGAKGSLWCPAGREKTRKKRGNPRRAGHGRRKRAVVPRRQRKNREEERKVVPGGAWRAKRSSHTPPAINK